MRSVPASAIRLRWTIFSLAMALGIGATAWGVVEIAASLETREIIGDQLASVGERGSAGSLAGRITAEPLGLDTYVLKAGPLEIPGVTRNASGLTYHAGRNSLFLVLNQPTQIVELSLDGHVRRIVPLRGFRDTEGITHVVDDLFAVVEERHRRVCFVKMPESGSSIRHWRSLPVETSLDAAGNAGPEGITFDPCRGEFFLVKERSPAGVFRLSRPAADGDWPAVTPLWSLGAVPRLKDLGGVYVDPSTGHLLILSDKPPCIIECTIDGREVDRLWLKRGRAGLLTDIPQAEGITMDPAGTLYICSEPNLLYVFVKNKSSARDGRGCRWRADRRGREGPP